jgi:uncharacterized protein (UPF0218 family)
LPRLILTQDLRAILKHPLGRLLSGSGSEIYQEIQRLASTKNPPRVILVGDAVSRHAVEARIRRDVMIIDNKEMRGDAKSFDASAKTVFRVRNQPGTIGFDAWAAAKEAIERGESVLVVDGEEDLLTLVAMVVAPMGSFVLYGQPNEGLVFVEVGDETKKKACELIDRMETVD